MRLWMLLAGSFAVIGKEKSYLKLENLVKPECDRIRDGHCRFFGTSSSFFGLARTLICNWQRPAVSFTTLAEYHASGSGIQFNLTFLLAIAVVFGLISHLAAFSRTGKMPVPQRVDFLVEQASCLFLKG